MKEFKPVKKGHTTNIYTGPQGVENLPVTGVQEDWGFTTNSVWVLPSILERIRFLFTGEITLRIMGKQIPCIAIVRGDIFNEN